MSAWRARLAGVRKPAQFPPPALQNRTGPVTPDFYAIAIVTIISHFRTLAPQRNCGIDFLSITQISLVPMRWLPKHLRRSRLGRLRPGGKPGCHHDELVVEKKFHIQIIRARLVGEGPRQSNYREIKGSLAQRRQVQRISAASRSAWGRCCSHTISWSTPWHPPRSRPVRAPCLPRSRQSRPLHSCCRGTDPGGVFERCDHLCCGRYLCNRAEICLNAAHKNRDQPACFLLRSALAPVGFHLKNAACGGLA